MPGGRPSKFPGAKGQILAAIRAGLFPEQAAVAAGASASAYYSWKSRGEREPSGEYHDFVEELRKAEAEAERNAVEIWRRAIDDDGDWRAAQAFLERRFPDRWRRRQTNELVGPDGGPIQTASTSALDLSRLSLTELAEWRRLYEQATAEGDRG